MGMKQERYLILTSTHIHNFRRKKLRRRIKIIDVAAVILSEKNTKEFVLHIPKEYDYRYICESRKEFIDILKLRYANLDSENTLKIYAVSENLRNYTTTLNDKKYGLYKLPEESKRKREEEIAGSKQMEEDEELEKKIELAQKEFEKTVIQDDEDETA